MRILKYKMWKEWHAGKGRMRVMCGDRLLGYVVDKKGADLLIDADKVGEQMYAAPPASRSKPTMFKNVAID
jgi:hypothetical protein